jgi:IS5 family transposase
MLRIHFMQQWFGLSDMAMEEALFHTPMHRHFAGLDSMARLPGRVSILRFRHLLQAHRLAEQFLATVNEQLAAKGYLLKEGSAIDATLIAVPTSTKNQTGIVACSRTRRRSPPCLRWATCGWCAGGFCRRPRHECARTVPKRRQWGLRAAWCCRKGEMAG